KCNENLCIGTILCIEKRCSNGVVDILMIAYDEGYIFAITGNKVKINNTSGTLQDEWEIEDKANEISVDDGYLFLLQKSKLHQFEKDGTYVQELSGEYDQSTLSQSYLVHQGKVYTTHRDGVWAGGFLVRSLPSENDPIREEEAAAFSSVTGRLTAQDATLNGTTSAEKIQTASLMPENGLTPGASVK